MSRAAGLWLAALLGWAAPGHPAAAAQPATNSPETRAFLREMARTSARADTVYTEFVQERHLALFEEPLRSEGVLCFRKPDAIRWETTRPYRSIFTCAGAGVAQFERAGDAWRKLELAHVKAMGNVVAGMSLFLEGRYLEREQDYDITVAKGAETVLTLVPRNEAARRFLQAIEIHLAPDGTTTRQVVLRQPDGDYTAIRFTRQVINVAYPPATFDLAHPADLELIRQAADRPGAP